MTAPQQTFLADFPCDRHCQVEMDLTEMHHQFTLRQMRAAAQHEHDLRHAPEPGPTPAHDRLAASFQAAS